MSRAGNSLSTMHMGKDRSRRGHSPMMSPQTMRPLNGSELAISTIDPRPGLGDIVSGTARDTIESIRCADYSRRRGSTSRPCLPATAGQRCRRDYGQAESPFTGPRRRTSDGGPRCRRRARFRQLHAANLFGLLADTTDRYLGAAEDASSSGTRVQVFASTLGATMKLLPSRQAIASHKREEPRCCSRSRRVC
jgi:hypothetical protein